MSGMLCSALSLYTPDRGDPFDEPWRWTELEFLNAHRVAHVAEDAEGCLWFLTENGILAYGKEYREFHSMEVEGEVVGDQRSIFVASDGTLYTGGTAVTRMRKGGEIEVIGQTPLFALTRNRFAESADGTVWFASPTGLWRIGENALEQVPTEMEMCSSLMVDDYNRLWVADEQTGSIYRYALAADTGELVGDPVRFLTPSSQRRGGLQVEFHRGREGRIWITSRSDLEGLRRIEGDELQVVLEDWKSVGIDNVKDVAEDVDGRLWVVSRRELVSYDQGVWNQRQGHEDKIPFSFPYLHFTADSRLLLGGTLDRSYAVDFSDSIWANYQNLNFQCSCAGGFQWFLDGERRVIRHDPVHDEWFMFEPEDGMVIEQPNSIFGASDGSVWVSGSHDGHAAVSVFRAGRWETDVHETLGTVFSHLSPFEDAEGRIYFGSATVEGELWGRSGGLVRYEATSGHPRYEYLRPPEYPVRVGRIAQASDGTLWFGGASLSYRSPGGPLQTIDTFAGIWVDDLAYTASDSLWVGAWGVGVFQLSGNTWRRYDGIDQETNRQFSTMLASRRLDGIWLATPRGVFRFDGRSWNRFYPMKDFRLKRESCELIESAKGEMWVNSAPRAWYFNEIDRVSESAPFWTARYRPDPSPPDTRIVLHESRAFEAQNVYIEWKGVDRGSRTPASEMEFSFRVNDGPWSPFESRTQTLIENVSPGEYRFEVRARDSDWNVDPTPANVSFTVVPFLWKQPWFIVTVFLTLSTIIALIAIIVRSRYRQILQMEAFKLDFFTNLSHELKTPLSVIVGPLHSLLQRNPTDETREMLAMALRNARKMQRLVEQLLEFRKVESGRYHYHPIRSDIVLFIKQSIYANEPLWKEKGHRFVFHISHDEQFVHFDPDMLEHVLDNLISNACKYTAPGGVVEVEIEIFPEGEGVEVGKLVIVVTDSGKGIPKERQKVIFELFHREVEEGPHSPGTGIGLAYTLEIVRIWGGTIGVESPVCQVPNAPPGTRFRVELPLRSDGYLPVVTDSMPAFEDADVGTETLEDDDRTVILIVEDNPDIRLFLRRELAGRYDTIEAADGKRGLEIAIERVPDLILTDLMMPEMDGFELCTQVRQHEATSHIPVVILTARKSEEFRLRGIEAGVDDFFAKPIHFTLLLTRIQKLLESRRLLRERYSRQVTLEPSSIQVSSVDEAFLKRAIEIVDSHMIDEDFDVKEFSKLIGMSRVSLYRKLKALTGHPPYHFIRDLRLKRAAQLLGTGQLTVGETLVQVGILDMSYFSKIFRQTYGMSPSEYRKQATVGGQDLADEPKPGSEQGARTE